jgi:hypothetical protein
MIGASAILSLLLLTATGRGAAIIADHSSVAGFDNIPSSVIEQIKTGYRLFYGHTSHGSQIVAGMEMLRSENTLYDFNNGDGTLTLYDRTGVDLGGLGDTSWVTITRERLDQTGNTDNVVMWSWCGGCSGNTEEGINIYLNALDQLGQDYPDVTFIYMTGHLDGTGPDGNLYARNNQIRDYCMTHDKILFDFADIESYDPDGTYYPDGSDDCVWCSVWCGMYSCPSCDDCAHSHCFNCYQKGKVFWWMMARMSGWIPGGTSCGDVTGDSAVNLTDILYLISYKYKGGNPPDPLSAGDIDNDGAIDLLDILYLITFKYKNGSEPPCP